MKNIPSAFQRATLWTAITAISITAVGALVVGLVYLLTRIISFLQPILIPFAVAGVLAYLLEPLVVRLMRLKLSRQTAVWTVFLTFSAGIIGIFLILVPAFVTQSAQFAKEVPGYVEKARTQVQTFAEEWNAKLKTDYGVDLLHWNPAKQDSATPEGAAPATPEGEKSPQDTPVAPPATSSEPTPSTATTTATPVAPAPSAAPVAVVATQAVAETEAEREAARRLGGGSALHPSQPEDFFTLQDLISGEWLRNAMPRIGQSLWNFIRTSVGGFLGVFGFMLSMVIVPLYLYYFLTESPKITQSWRDYVPLRTSQFKDEVVDTLGEINRYLIAFFRGQLVVSLINGIATGIGLMAVGLKFGWLIGLGLCFLGIIPYLGIIACWIPAVIIASVQGDSYFTSTQSAWWVLPVIVTVIFAVVQQIDGLFITPKIVGESVGLHPMTVIVSVFAWSLIMGGLLGAILAVPMTAALKVLFQRYVWQRAVSNTLQHP